MVSYKLERSIRRTLSLQIKPDGTILVKAPVFLPQHEIDKFVNIKSNWIEKTLKKIQKRGIQAPIIKHQYIENENFFYLGSKYPLSFSSEFKQKLVFNEKFVIPIDIAKKGKLSIKKILITWYKNRARDLF